MAMKRQSKIRKCKPRVFSEDISVIDDQGLMEKPREKPQKNKDGKGFEVKKFKHKPPISKWKPVPVNYDIDFDGFGGIEELTEYNAERPTRKSPKRKQSCHYDDSDENLMGSEKKKLKQHSSKKIEKTGNHGVSKFKFSLIHSPEYIAKIKRQNEPKKNKNKIISNVNQVVNSDEDEIDMSRWDNLFIPASVLRALKEMKFVAPTPIQAYTLPSAIRDRMDILGAAETGSGKTLAFAIPIIHGILRDKAFEEKGEKEKTESENEESLTGDEGIASDRNEDDSENSNQEYSDDSSESTKNESEVEMTDEEREASNNKTENDEEIEDLNPEDLNNEISPSNHIKIEKPLRALILTPTRELAIQVQRHIEAAAKYTDIRVAVVVGGMASEKQIRILSKGPEIVVATPGRLWELIEQGNEHLNRVADAKYLVIDEADRMVEKGHFEELKKVLDLMRNNKDRRQNFIFSATLTMVHSTPKRLLLKKKKYKLTQKIKLDSIMEMVGMKDKPKVVDITKKFGTADTLTEAKLFCNIEDKDAYLYYFRLTYPGRTLVFCNSIDCVRRLKNVFQNLNCQPLPLHSSMAQRQRLKNLDRFRNNPQSLLLSTDVAARGLDIHNIQHVIHYQVPKTAETYVHRSGRTARALNEGLSLMLLSPQEITTYRKLCRTLNRDKDLSDFPVNQDILTSVHERVGLARKLDVLSHRLQKKSSQNSWLLQTAEKMDIDIEDGDLRSEVDEGLKQNKKDSDVIKKLRKELDSLLKKPIAPRGIFTRYPTQTGKLQLDKMATAGSAIAAVGKQIPWSNYEEKIQKGDPKLIDKKVKKNKKKYWKPKSNR